MVFGFGKDKDNDEPKTLELRSPHGGKYWINNVPANKIESLFKAQKMGWPIRLDFPVTEGARLVFNWENLELLLIRDAPVDAGNNVFHYLEDAEEDEDSVQLA